MRDQRSRPDPSEEVGEIYQTGVKPGAVTLTQHLPVQRKAKSDARPPEAPAPESFGFLQAYGGDIQKKSDAAFPDERPTPWMAAEQGTSGSAGRLPHLDQIQQSFGRHDVSSVRAYTDSNAAAGASAMGAEAYAVGDQVAFGGAPTLHTAAHEAAHVVQQRAGVSLKGGVGQAGDPYERHADAVADKVVRGESAETLLDEMAGTGGAATRAVQQRRGVMRPDAARPERTQIQITGRYEAVEPGGSNRITIELNQAGTHFEGWWQRRVSRFGSGARMEHKRINGDLTNDGADAATFRYERSRDGAAGGTPGTLTATRSGDSIRLRLVEGSGAVSVDRDGNMSVDEWNHEFRQTSDTARLSEQGLESLPSEARPAARASEDAPLDSDQEGRLRRNADVVKERVRGFLDAARGVARDAHASGLDSVIEGIFTQHATEQHILVRQRLHEMLVSATFTSGSINRPYWDWLAVIVATSPTYTTHMQSRLGIPASGIAADSSAPQNQYSWSFSVVGLAGDVGIGLGGFLGQFTIEQTAGAATWRTNYFTVLGQGSGGLSAGVTVGMRTSNTFQSPFPWRSGNFRGAYTITGAAAGGALADTGGAYGAGFINFYGDGSFPVVSGDAGGFTELAGLYIGGEMSQSGGYLFGGRDEAIAYARSHRPRDVAGAYTAGAAAHFAVDDPSLTDLGRQELRRVCALQRAMLTNPSGSIAVTGYASPTGTDSHNLTLSELRAQNTLQAIRDIMGADLVIPAGQQSSRGLGEAPARASGIPDGTESDPWRKVEVAINGTVVLTLRY